MLFQSNVQWEPTFLLNIMSVRVAGWVPTRTRRVSWSVSPVLKEPPQPTCTPAASLSAKVQDMHMNRKTSVFLCSDLNVIFHIWDFFLFHLAGDVVICIYFQGSVSPAVTLEMGWRSVSHAPWVTSSLLLEPESVRSVPMRLPQSPEEPWMRQSVEVI